MQEPRLYTLAGQHRVSGFPHDSVFYTFPARAAAPDGDVPSGYVVVGGADYNTYMRIYLCWNYVRRGDPYPYDHRIEPNTTELLLARQSDLEPVE